MFFKKEGEDWNVLIADKPVGKVTRTSTQVTGRAYRFTPEMGIPGPFSNRTMAGLKQDVAEGIAKEIYMEILDAAYSAGYKG